MSLHLPPSRYPAPSPVIQASTEADLQNRQGRCLRNSSVRIVPVADKRRFPPAIMPLPELDIKGQAGGNHAAERRSWRPR